MLHFLRLEMMSLSGKCHLLRNTLGNTSDFKLLGFEWNMRFNSSIYGGGSSLRSFTTKAVGKRNERLTSQSGISNLKFFDGKNIHQPKLKSEILGTYELRNAQCPNTEQIATDSRLFGWPAVLIAFDIETTGCHREDRIIEVAFRDLRGGKNSTLQSLVNPEKEIKNSFIHRITTEMVTRSGVPRMRDLIPILLQYIESRRIDGKPVVLVAHNGRRFDVPFFMREFNRCSVEFPLDWLFIDTLPLARKFVRTVRPEGKKRESVSLQSLREHYGISSTGAAHRAMEDVTTLCLVLQKISFEFKLSVTDLMEDAFSASDIPV